MSDGTRGNREGGSRPPDDAALSARLRRLGERLDETAVRRPPPADPASGLARETSAFARGFRMSTELVAGVVVGAVIGWALDRGLGITPWGMIVFVLLGFAGGVLNVIRAAGAGPGKPGTGTAAPLDDDDED